MFALIKIVALQPKCLNKSLALDQKNWTKVKVLFCTTIFEQRSCFAPLKIWTKVFLHTNNGLTKVLISTQMFKQNSCFAPKMFAPYIPKMFEQKCCFAPKIFKQKSCFAPKMFKQNPKKIVLLFTQDLWTKLLLCTKMFDLKTCFASNMFEQKSCLGP